MKTIKNAKGIEVEVFDKDEYPVQREKGYLYYVGNKEQEGMICRVKMSRGGGKRGIEYYQKKRDALTASYNKAVDQNGKYIEEIAKLYATRRKMVRDAKAMFTKDVKKASELLEKSKTLGPEIGRLRAAQKRNKKIIKKTEYYDKKIEKMKAK